MSCLNLNIECMKKHPINQEYLLFIAKRFKKKRLLYFYVSKSTKFADSFNIFLMDKISYALGLSMGNNFLSSGIKTINISDFSKAVEVVLKGEKPEISYDEAKQIINDFFMELQEEKLGMNLQAGEEFLRINKEKSGVVALPSGLQYEVISEGTGSKPTASDKVKCHYEGRLLNGQVFDSSIKRGQPATFPLNQVIKGWTEGLQLMSIGSKYRFFIPSGLAYGANGAGEMIEPNSTLIFDVELLDIV